MTVPLARYRIARESEEATLYLYGPHAECGPLLASLALMPEEVHYLGEAPDEAEALRSLSILARRDNEDPAACVISARVWAVQLRAVTLAGVH